MLFFADLLGTSLVSLNDKSQFYFQKHHLDPSKIQQTVHYPYFYFVDKILNYFILDFKPIKFLNIVNLIHIIKLPLNIR